MHTTRIASESFIMGNMATKSKKAPIEQALADAKKTLKIISNEVSNLQSSLASRENRVKRLECQLEDEKKSSQEREESLLHSLFGNNAQYFLEGLAFEKHVVWWMDKFCNNYKLKIWQGDKSCYIHNIYKGDHLITASWNSYPDLIFVDEEQKKVIAIECKYRFDGIFALEKSKYEIYKQFQDKISKLMHVETRVYIMVGTGGFKAGLPDWMYCLPIDSYQFSGNIKIISRDMRNEPQYKVLERCQQMCIKANVPF